jgi:hypothetical protein
MMRKVTQGADVTVTARLSTLPNGPAPVLRLAARGTVLRVDELPEGRYGIAIEFKRRRIL